METVPLESSGMGKAVYDGYYAKCEASGKEATATLSVLDLEKLEGVRKAFDAMAGDMKESAVEAPRAFKSSLKAPRTARNTARKAIAT